MACASMSAAVEGSLRALLVEYTVVLHGGAHALNTPTALPTQGGPNARLASTRLGLVLRPSPSPVAGFASWLKPSSLMSAPLYLTEVLARQESSPQADLPLATEDVLRYVWEGKFGSMLIEVRHGQAYVNGQLVEPVREEPLRD